MTHFNAFIYRMGQDSSVRIIYIIAREPADDILWDQINRKHDVVGATVGIIYFI